MKVALFGASGKIGTRALALLRERGHEVRALIHRTPLPEAFATEVETVPGSVTDTKSVDAMVSGADIVLMMATTKEDPATFFDVSIKGTFQILEACRRHRPRQVILLGGDAAQGIWFYPHPQPISETDPKIAYPGYYAFSKVMEETMAEQYRHQYGLATTILRSSWVFDGDDLLNHFSLLKNVDPAEKGHGFGEPSEATLDLVRAGEEHLPILLDRDGEPLHRHIVHIDDVIHALDRMIANPAAFNEDFNIAAPAAFDYRTAANCLAEKTGLPTIEIPCPDYHGFEIDISKARERIGYDPQNDFATMADRAIAFRKKREGTADGR
ncbi:MAG: NAD(P)-dependent oxidoreductase [Verrucomicrobiae bacterium]|nr:NAD(P)-dependent oxidoreductase [Verrucomicrobiae bacterium]